ncbi:MAG: c-type cytochrome [Verrucomicrobia bacterium]|nr:c-type cytochrome [Verrucomicrobiota bacterium]
MNLLVGQCVAPVQALRRPAFTFIGRRPSKAITAFLALLLIAASHAQPADPQRTAVAIEALSRLTPEQIKSNPKLEAALKRVIEATRGTPQFVEVVRKFQITNENPALLAIAIQNATNSFGTDAVRAILEAGDAKLLRDSLNSTSTASATRLAEALGNVAEKKVVPLLEPIVADSQRDAQLRKQAVRGLAQNQEGASVLLKLAKEERLAPDIRLLASMELNAVRWPRIKSEAAQLLPLPQARNAQPLPSIAELTGKRGDAARGAEVYSRAEAGCINCHQVNGQGIDFGPKLSEIGAKLGKDALYEAILNPSAGISFGYEAWQLELKNGDEAYGLLVSETADELAIKTQNGIVTRYKKSEVAKRQMMKTSIMPSDLQQTMSLEELIDLVEYLASLKKVG